MDVFSKKSSRKQNKISGDALREGGRAQVEMGGGRFLEEALMPWVGRGPRDRDGSEEEIIAPRFSGTCI